MDSSIKINKENIDEKYKELKSQFLDMAQLKSEFDMEKFTVMSQGNFIAHNFHFLMRQYSLTLYEAKRIVIDIEEKNRRIKECNDIQEKGGQKILTWTDKGQENKYVDIEIERAKNEKELLDMSFVNKYKRCEYFEKLRLKLIELNNGEIPTNEQYQKEEPGYWEWFLKRKAVNQARARQTGVNEGVWDNIDNLEMPALLNEEYQIEMLNEFCQLDLAKVTAEIEKAKGKNQRAENVLSIARKQKQLQKDNNKKVVNFNK